MGGVVKGFGSIFTAVGSLLGNKPAAAAPEAPPPPAPPAPEPAPAPAPAPAAPPPVVAEPVAPPPAAPAPAGPPPGTPGNTDSQAKIDEAAANERRRRATSQASINPTGGLGDTSTPSLAAKSLLGA
jgi:hypothetical protein